MDPTRTQAKDRIVYSGPYLQVRRLWGGAIRSEMHDHPELQVTILSNQSCIRADWLTEGGSKRQRPIVGQAVCVTPGSQPHAMDWTAAGDSIVIGISPELIKEPCGTMRSGCPFQESYGTPDGFVQHLGDLFKNADDYAAPFDRLRAESTAVVLLEHLRTQAGSSQIGPGPDKPLDYGRLARVQDYIHANLENELSIVNLSQMAQMSEFHFARRFKAALGITPHQYVIERRIERTKILLRNPGVAIAEIAYRSGFATQAHLTTVFRRVVGMTPKAYRVSGTYS